MAGVRGRRSRQGGADYWPGFVDAMATLLLVMTFLLSVFMIAQYFVTREVAGKDSALERLNRQIAQLTELLALEQGQSKSFQEELASLTASLAILETERNDLQQTAGVGAAALEAAQGQAAGLAADLEGQKGLTNEALSRIELLNQQVLALRRQIATLSAALDASEAKAKEGEDRIDDLGRRLNVALARKVQQLERYQSEFFGRLRELLAQRDDVRIVGDRFVFQSEVLFPSGAAQINPAGEQALAQIGRAIREIASQIPDDINWVLQVDGHTDANPINTPEFPSNWELSQARALAVVKFLNSLGISNRNLVAAGFAEFQPLDNGESPEALRRNRRIELKLTNR